MFFFFFVNRCAGGRVRSPRCCLCASLAQRPGQGEGLILCGLKRINFVLTLAGCGLHPYPPLFSVPGAKERRRQASRDGEHEGERYRVRKRERGGALFLRSVISQKAFILSSSLYFHFMSQRWCKSSSNMCVTLAFEYACVTGRARMCVYQGRADCCFISSRAG